MVQKHIGIDPAIAGKHVASILGSTGEKERTFSFTTNMEDFDTLISLAKGNASQQVKLNFIMEPTSTVWMPLAFYFAHKGHKVFMIKPEKAHDLRKFYRKHAKSDRIDSYTLAKMPLVDKDGLYPFILPQQEYFSLNRLCRHRAKLVKKTSGIQCKIRTIMYLAIPGLEKVFKDLFSTSGRKFLSSYVDPHKVKALGLKRFTGVLKRAAKGKLDDRAVEDIYDACIKAVNLYSQMLSDGVLPFSYCQLQKEVNRELSHLEFLENQVEKLNKEIEEKYLKLDPHQILRDLKGIGPVHAPVLLALFGNIAERFSSVRKFIAFCGLAPRKKQSSTKDKKGMKISKAANWQLKETLYMIAETARHWDPESALLYHKLMNKGKHHKQAICAVAAKIAREIYAVLKRVQNIQRMNQKVADELVEDLRFQLRDFSGNEITPKDARTLILSKFPNSKKTQAHGTKSSHLKKRGKIEQLNRGSASHSTKDFSIHSLSDLLCQIKNDLAGKDILSDSR